jgi:hypothetical protein
MNCADLNPFPDGAAFRRPAAKIMRLSRLGSAHPMRLSFLRILLRRLKEEKWRFDRPVFDIDAKGVGRAVYRAIGPVRTYSLVCFAHDLPAEMRSDRVIATAWDATFALFDGTPEPADLDRLQDNVPLQEAGRITHRELTLSRANRSVRLFDHVVKSLSEGKQPEQQLLMQTGYLMRTTAVYGSGKFGAADRDRIANRAELMCPFQAEMLSVWLTRTFTVDLVDHLAKARGGAQAARLGAAGRSLLGVGNSTGLGMAPFLVRHPLLLNNWLMVREEALARVRSQSLIREGAFASFRSTLDATRDNAERWHSNHPLQIVKLQELRSGLALLSGHVDAGWQTGAVLPWDTLWRWGEQNLAVEAQEALLSLMLEPHGELVDGLAHCMSADERSTGGIDGAMTIGRMRSLIRDNHGWALVPDYNAKSENARFWYVSEDKLEPRLGERHSEPGGDQELPLDIGRQIAMLDGALSAASADAPVAAFLLQRPQHRNAVRRVQMAINRPFSEIQDNLLSADLMPIDMLRLKLAFFGATRFDPRSDRWVRISLFQGQPYPEDLTGGMVA